MPDHQQASAPEPAPTGEVLAPSGWLTRKQVEVIEPTSLLGKVRDPAQAFDHIWSLIPQDQPRRLWRFLECDGGLFIKGQNIPPRLTRAHYARSRRLLAEQRRLIVCVERGLPYSRCVAWGAERRLGLVSRSFLVLRVIPDVVDLAQYFLSGDTHPPPVSEKGEHSGQALRDRPDERVLNDEDHAARRRVIETVAAEVARMHAAQVFHRDLSPRNILLQFPDDGAPPNVHFIDCPRAVIDPPGMLRENMLRSELYHFVKGLRKVHADDGECRAALAALSDGTADTLMTLVDEHVAHDRRPKGAARFLMTGKLP